MHFLQQARTIVSRKGAWLAIFALIPFAGAALAERFAPDPVNDLREALSRSAPLVRLQDPGFATRYEELVKNIRENKADQKQTKKLEDERDKLLATVANTAHLPERINALRTIPEMRRGLTLNEWQISSVGDDFLRDLHQKLRRTLLDRFESALRRALQSGNLTARLAAINTLAEIGPFALLPHDREGMGRDFGPDLVEVMRKDPSPAARALAARALGQVFADPVLAAKALAELLASGDVSERRSAASGMVAMVHVATDLAARSDVAGKVELFDPPTDLRSTAVAAAAKNAIRVASRGLSDADAEVRALCAQVFQQAAYALYDRAPKQNLSDERDARPVDPRLLEEARERLKPLVDEFKSQADVLAKALSDSSPDVRSFAARSCEDIAQARNLLLQRAGEGAPPRLPPPAPRPRAESESRSTIQPSALQNAPVPAADDALLGALKPSVQALARAVSDPSVEVRLKALDAIEAIGTDASAATPALVKALHDPNVFVRWAAARTLGKVGLDYPTIAVPGLARALGDEDFDVDVAAARALDHFGPAAVSALPAFIKALSATDAEKRREVLRTIQSVGTGAASAIPAVIARIDDPDPKVRKLAADVLGLFGSAASEALPALRRALNDPEVDVRRAATDAILNIQP